jgi:hypothetical protein
MSRNEDPEKQEPEWGWAQSNLHKALLSGKIRYGHLEKANPEQQSTALVTMNDAALARLVRDGAGIVEGDKVEELVVGVRPVLRGFRYGGNIHLSNTAKLFNCAALEVYVDGQRFTLYPGSDMEVRPGTTARMEVEPTARSTASIESVLCTFYGKP